MPTVVQSLYPNVLLKKTLPSGTLFIADKPWIERPDGTKVQLTLDLRYWYDKKAGFVIRQTRSDSDVIKLALEWSNQCR